MAAGSIFDHYHRRRITGSPRVRAGRAVIRLRMLEASSRVGGVIPSEHADDITIEAGPDAMLALKPRPWPVRALGLDA